MKNILKIQLIALSFLLLTGCFTFKYGPVPYMEPGGTGANPDSAPIASSCASMMTHDFFSDLWKKTAEKSKTIENATLTLQPSGLQGCLELRGTAK
ncbi:MAG: hypothetical protein KDK39_11820 [Leptospiraceae bacterium]|nr:hypothetical protein [Leptospiraceae bacterium]